MAFAQWLEEASSSGELLGVPIGTVTGEPDGLGCGSSFTKNRTVLVACGETATVVQTVDEAYMGCVWLGGLNG